MTGTQLMLLNRAAGVMTTKIAHAGFLQVVNAFIILMKISSVIMCVSRCSRNTEFQKCV